MEELENWYKQISSLERLKLKEAQEIYKKAINANSETSKKAYLDKIILGTLYVVYEHIKRNNLERFVSSSYDMNDIISSFNEVWIKKIYNGDLLNVESYSLLFNSKFFNEVYTNLCGDEIVVNEQFGIPKDCFIDIFMRYIEFKNKSPDSNFRNVIEKYYGKDIMDFYTYKAIIPFVDILYRILNNDEEKDLNIGKKKINDYLRFIINKGLVEPITNELLDENNIENNILRNMILEQFIEDVDQVFMDERMKQIIHERFGLDGEDCLSFDDVGKIHGITSQRVIQVEGKALRKLRYRRNIRKYEEENI